MMSSGGYITVGSGGTLGEVGVPVAVLGAAATGHGLYGLKNAATLPGLVIEQSRDANTGRFVKNSDTNSDSGPYGHLQDPDGVGPGKDFTPAQKEQVIRENMRRNGGVVRSDKSGIQLSQPAKSQRGVTPDPNEWQIDHNIAKDKSGTNSYRNARVLSRAENRAKGNQ